MLYRKSKEFLDQFCIPINFDNVKKYLIDISKLNFKLHDCNTKFDVSFNESKLFGKFASVKNNHISFNKTRLEILCKLKIDCNNKKHLERIYKFHESYTNNNTNSIHEEVLYEFMEKYIAGGYERYFSQMGSYKHIKFELLDTLFHENQHILQKDYEKYFNDINNAPEDVKSATMIFTMFFNKIYELLKNDKKKFTYTRENYIFPIEFDARYEAMINLSNIKQMYFPKDKNFSQYIINSYIIPEGLNFEDVSKLIFSDYKRLFELHKEKANIQFKEIHKYLLKNQNIIIEELERRYLEMYMIVKLNKTEKSKNEE